MKKKDKTKYMYTNCFSNTKDADEFIKMNKIDRGRLIILVQWVE